MRTKFPCKNHPERMTSKRCFNCKDYICTECQKLINHHLFCGLWCGIKYMYLSKLVTNKKIREYAFLVAIMFGLQIIFYTVMNSDTADISEEVSSVHLSDNRNIYPSGYDVSLDTVFDGLSKSISIEGSGQNNSLLGLWHNGLFASSTVINNKNYSFPPQSLYLGKNSFIICLFFN